MNNANIAEGFAAAKTLKNTELGGRG